MATEKTSLPTPKLHAPSVAAGISSHIVNQQTSLPGHLERLPGTNWAVWRWIVLRGAGFSANEVSKLAAPECAEAADDMLEAEAELEAVREQMLDAIRSEFGCDNRQRDESLVKALRRLKKGNFPKELEGRAGFESMLMAMHGAMAQLETKQAEFRAAFKSATDRISKAMLEIARSNRFREAILWQNRNAIHSGVDALLRMSTDTNERGSYRKRREELIANYLQRYCLKNDTIGFFGPVGWAQFVTDGPPLEANAGNDLLAARRVYFEVWGLDVLAETLTNDERFRPWIVPRRMSFAWVENTTLHAWPKEPITLDDAEVDLFNSCDGKRTAKEIARALMANHAFRDEEQVFRGLRRLETLGVITWKLEARVAPYPEESLREQFALIDEPLLRSEAESKLAQLEAARMLVAQAAGNPKQLDQALSQLEETFTALTGAPATRAAGRTYAGRTLVYEDCRRDVEVKVGPAATAALGEPLSLLLESARWLTHVVAEKYRQAFVKLFSTMTAESGVSEVEFIEFWSASRRMLFDEEESLVTPLAAAFQQRWAQVLDVPEDKRAVHYSSAALRDRVEAAFQAPKAGWLSARYHNPDVMIAPPSAEAVRRGDYVFVMGELHIAANALGVPLFMEQHESPEELWKAFDWDMPEPRLMPLVPKYWPALTPRLMLTLATPRDYRLEMAPGPFDVPAANVVTSRQLVVTRTANGQLVVRTRDRRLSFDVIEAFASAISGEVANHFKPLPPAPHTPRVSFDRLVVCRETWRFAASDVWFAFEKEMADRFAEARRWAGFHELPRHVFVKAAVEVKPCYVDLASPVYVELFGKMIRRCVEHGLGESDVVVTEMLPGPGESWLPDAAGERYSSELRMVALDLKDHKRMSSSVE
ncbi:MAG TPA: lantibiotic dehydratase [Pyrinomonadaceae bacterium]|nr:lantibiotic dehydratase [Pyrinomonadaceae bacterium]